MAKKAAATTANQQRVMSDEHKAALAEGREQGRIVRAYLQALESHRPRRGRKRTPEAITKRLAAVNGQLSSADPLTRLHLVQERMDLEHELATLDGDGVDMGELEAGFVEVALAYSERKGITYGLAVDRRGAAGPEGSLDYEIGAVPRHVRRDIAAASDVRPARRSLRNLHNHGWPLGPTRAGPDALPFSAYLFERYLAPQWCRYLEPSR